MPVCDVCGEVAVRVYACADCGTKFCKDCGDSAPKKKVCSFCSLHLASYRSNVLSIGDEGK